MGTVKEPCGLDITLEDIRKIENRYDVTVRAHFDKIARAWCFDFERGVYISRLVFSASELSTEPKDKFLETFAEYASYLAK